MMFGGIFTELATPQLAALLSCFVFEEKAGGTKLADDLSGCLRAMQVSHLLFCVKINEYINCSHLSDPFLIFYWH